MDSGLLLPMSFVLAVVVGYFFGRVTGGAPWSRR